MYDLGMSSKKPLYGKKDGRGQHMVVPIGDHVGKQIFLDWLTTPLKEREAKTVTDFCRQHDLSRNTVKEWKSDPEFIKEWEKRYLRTIGNPGRKSEIMDTLYRTATDPDDPKHVAAAKQYFEIEGSMRPQKLDVQVTGDPKSLTDEDLAALLAEHAAKQLEQRGEAG